MTPSPAELLDGRLKPSSSERKFDEFLKQHELHFTQSECGLGWVDRNYSNSGIYRHSVALDVVNPSIRQALPSVMGARALFRFMIPASDATPPHLTVSDQQLTIPGVKLTLPPNPDMLLDVGAQLMLAKSQAVREFRALQFDPSVSQITMLLAIWSGWSWQDGKQGAARTIAIPTQMIQWLSGVVPPYLCVVKWLWPERFKDLTVEEASRAAGIPARRLNTLYPTQENES